MKRTFLIALLAAVAMTSWAQENNFTVKCNIVPLVERFKQGDSIKTIYLNNGNNGKRVAETPYKGDSIIVISGRVEEPVITELTMESENGVYAFDISLITEPGDIVLKIKDIRRYSAEGTPLNDACFATLKEIDRIGRNGDLAKKKQIAMDYISQHKDDISAVMLLKFVDSQTKEGAQNILSLISQCCDAVQQHNTTKHKVKVLNKKLEGSQKFIDFTAEYNGSAQKLSDYVGKGRYVLADFWASWFGSCKEKMPSVIALHEKYKDKAFTVLGVAVSDKPEATLEAAKALNIPFQEIINAGQKPVELYDIQAIPYYILFDPDGTILTYGNNLDEAKAKIEEIFGKE